MQEIAKNEKIKRPNNDKTIARGLILIALYVLFSFLMEIINFVSLKMGVLPTNILLDLAFWMIVAGILLLIPSDIARIVISSVLIFLQMALNIANETLINITSSVFHLSQFKQASEGTEGFDWGLINWWVVAINVLMFASFLTIALVINKKVKKSLDEKIKKKIVTIVASILCFEAVGLSFAFIGNSVYKNSHDKIYSETYAGESVLWNGMYFRNETFKALGTFGFYFKDLATEINYSSKLNAEQISAVKNALESSNSDTSTYSNLAVDSATGKTDNLIYILMESLDTFAIDPYNTPNLWKLAYGDDTTYEDASAASSSVVQGTYFSNFHGFNYTNDSEVISILGHTTIKNRLFDTYNSVGIEVPYSLPNLFKNAGYTNVNFFHGYIKTYYNRNILNKELGYSNVYGIEDSKFKTSTFGGWISDSEYIEDMMDKFIPEGDEPFFSFYTSITAHGPYDYKNERLDANKQVYDANYEKYSAYMKANGNYLPTDETYASYLRQYKSAVMEDDKMVGKIFEELERQGKLDTTTIVLFADHNCFYHNMSAVMKEADISKGDIELYNIPLYIYNDSLTKGVNNTFCTTYDLYPTLCSMFGFEYNTALTHGYDILSDDIKNSYFVSFKTGAFNENYYTDNLYKIYATNDKNLGKEQEFKNQVLNFYKKQNIIENIYKTKYLKVTKKLATS